MAMSIQRKAVQSDLATHPGANEIPYNSQYSNDSKQHRKSNEVATAWPANLTPSLTTESVELGTIEPLYYSEPEQYTPCNIVDNQISGQVSKLQLDTTTPSYHTEILNLHSLPENDSSSNGSPATSHTSAGSLSPQAVSADGTGFPEAMVTSADLNQPSIIRNKTTKALQDASFFLGGLVKHPTESTKHFTILRHSHGLVYYKGPDTSLALTVFADRSLPLDRQYWLQMKGWTGNTGMKAKALFRTTNDWINVTPSRRVSAVDLAPIDEKAWQRDIKHFRDHATKQVRSHVIRETIVLRLPFEAADGYFRVNMTQGNNRRPLCSSPVFRVASTSMSAGSVKGASLGTLPLELGVNVLQFAARQMATNTVSPVANTARQQVAGLLPSAVQSYGQTAYNLSGVDKRVESMNNQYEDMRKQQSHELSNASYSEQRHPAIVRPDAVDHPTGPSKPFPIHLQGQIVQDSIHAQGEYGIPTTTLINAPIDQIAPLKPGSYFGWASINYNTKKIPDQNWQQTIITISQQQDFTVCNPSQIAIPKTIQIHFLDNNNKNIQVPTPDPSERINPKLSLVVMGFLRSPLPPPPAPLSSPSSSSSNQKNSLTGKDIETTYQILSQDSWSPPQPSSTSKPSHSLSDKYIQTRTNLQRRVVDRVPVHRLGVRNQSTGIMDRGMYGNGGVYVVRD